MIAFPNAKINLGLHVVGKRPDGYHNIETVLFPVSLCDVLEILPGTGSGIEFMITGLPLPGGKKSNLVLKAFDLISGAGYHLPDNLLNVNEGAGGGEPAGLRMHLHKVIPAGSGLGGGSSDGAFTLKMLNGLLGLSLTDERLETLASELGSDCAFFIRNIPVLATGRGNQLEPVDMDLSGYRIIVMVPKVHISTPEAYSLVTPRQPEHSLKDVIREPVEEWRNLLVNDFEQPVMAKYPEIREAKQELYRFGAVYAAMSGSGAAVYGIFQTETETGNLKQLLRASCKIYILDQSSPISAANKLNSKP